MPNERYPARTYPQSRNGPWPWPRGSAILRSSIGELREKLESADIEKFLDKIMSLGHHSVLEHVSFTFAIEGISRVTTHQLVRHRIASFSQQSQRYVSHKEHFTSIVPDSIAADRRSPARFSTEMSDTVHKAYGRLIEMGIPAEDARYILPNATETKIIMTMNARELLHFFALRCCERAQWEIRAHGSRDAAAGETGRPGHLPHCRSRAAWPAPARKGSSAAARRPKSGSSSNDSGRRSAPTVDKREVTWKKSMSADRRLSKGS